jgi:transposase
VPLHMLLPHLTLFHLLAHYRIDGVLHLELKARRRSAACPRCQHRSTAVHSSYLRTVTDLPIGGAPVLLHLRVRRFFCRYGACSRRIFAERFSALAPDRGRYSAGVYATLGIV